MKQVIIGGTYNNVGDIAPCYTPLRGNRWASSGLPNYRMNHPWSVAGTFKKLYVQIKWPEENSSTYTWPDLTFTLYIDDTPTSLTVTVPAATGPACVGFVSSASNTASSVTITPGQTVALVRGAGTIVPGVNASTAFIGWSLTFESDNAGESGYGLSSYADGSIGASNLLVSAPFYGGGGMDLATDTPDAPNAHSLVPLEGALTRLDVLLHTAPGVGATRTFAAMLNQVLQDGSGGTVDTQLAITGSATTGHVTFSLPISVLDQLNIVQLVSGGTAPATTSIAYSIAVTATNDGESALGFYTEGSHPINDGTTDFAGGQDGGWAWTTARAPTPSCNMNRWPMSELSMSLPGPLDGFSLSGLCVNLSAVPGTGKSYTFTTRKAEASTSSVCTIADGDVIAVGTGAAGIYVSPSDLIDLQSIASGTPSGTQIAWTWLVVDTIAPPVVSTSYPIRRLRRFALPFDQNKWIFISRVELIMQAGNGLSGTAATVQGYNPIVMFRLSRDGGATWDDELQMATGKIGEYTARAYLNRLGRARNPVVELTSSDPVFVSWIDFTVDYEEGMS